MAKKKWTAAARKAFAAKMKAARAAKRGGRKLKRVVKRRRRRGNPTGLSFARDNYLLVAKRGDSKLYFNGKTWGATKANARKYATIESAATAGRMQLKYYPMLKRSYKVYVGH
jgi:hypothetical protein